MSFAHTWAASSQYSSFPDAQAAERTPHEYLGESNFQDYIANILQPHAEDEREV